MTTLVVGRGLLGGHLVDELGRQGEAVVTVDVPWADPDRALDALVAAAARAAGEGADWRLAWCAGAGVVATPAEDFAAEIDLFRRFVDAVLGAGTVPHSMFLASSAGGLYAGSVEPPFTERHEPAPLNAYGRVKLESEVTARRLGGAGTRLVIGRIANLYGPGQDLTKPQGLVSQLCVTHVTGRPLNVYASFDTMRDYLYVSDAAVLVAACLDRVSALPSGSVVVKVLASGASTSVGGLVDASTRAFRRRPHVVQCAARAGTQVLDLRLRSVVWTDLDHLVRTPLLVGLRATADSVEELHRRGRLAGAAAAQLP